MLKILEANEIKMLREKYKFSEEEIKFLNYFKFERKNGRKGLNKLDIDFMRNEKGNIIREIKYNYLQSIFTKIYNVGVRGDR